MSCHKEEGECSRECPLYHAAIDSNPEMLIVFRLIDRKKMKHPHFAMGVHDGYFNVTEHTRFGCSMYCDGAVAGAELWNKVMSLTEAEREALLHELHSTSPSARKKPPAIRFVKFTDLPQPTPEPLTRSWDPHAFSAHFLIHFGAPAIAAH